MDAAIDIPNEARAAVECNALFDALRHGDYPAAARAQTRLHELGWDLRRVAHKPPRRPAVPRAGTAGREGARP
jgi:hypothetical protein